MSKRKRPTFLRLTAERAGGTRKAAKVMAFVMQWTAVHADLRRRPKVDEYADFWGMSLATAYRELATFREVWPEFLTPSDVALALGIDPANATMPMPTALGDPLAAQ